MTAVENLKGDINRGAQLFTTIGCNACHTAVQRGAIRITLGTDHNPFNQSFAP